MTLQDYYNAILADVPTAATLTTSSIYDAINKARRSVAAETDATLDLYSFTLTAGTWNYPFPASVTASVLTGQIVAVRKIWYYLGTVRNQIPKELIGSYSMSNFQSWPVKWWTQQNKVYYWPIPAQAYPTEWLCQILPANLVNPGDAEVIPYQYTDAIEALACRYTALKDGNAQLAGGFGQLYMELLGKLPRRSM